MGGSGWQLLSAELMYYPSQAFATCTHESVRCILTTQFTQLSVTLTLTSSSVTHLVINIVIVI